MGGSASKDDTAAAGAGAAPGEDHGMVKKDGDEKKGDETVSKSPNQALLYAASQGNKDAIRAAIDAGASVNALDVEPVSGAVNDGSNKSKKAEKKQALVEVIYTGDTALHKAAEKGLTETVRLLFFLSADLEIQNKMGSTALHRAVSCGHVDTVEFLLSKGARVDVTNLAGNNPLHCACYVGNLKIVQMLLDAGAARLVDRTNRANMTPIDYARKMPIKALLQPLMAPAPNGLPRKLSTPSLTSSNFAPSGGSSGGASGSSVRPKMVIHLPVAVQEEEQKENKQPEPSRSASEAAPVFHESS